MPFAGGQEIGSGYVTIGADLTGLKDAEKEAKAIVANIGKMTARVGLGGGGSTGTTSMEHGVGGTILGGSFSNPTDGAPPAGPILGSGMLTPSFGAPAMESIASSEIAATDALAVASLRPAGTRALGVGGFGMKGVISRAIGIPYAEVFAAIAATHVAGVGVQSYEISTHPGAFTMDLDQPGQLSMSGDPFLRSIGQRQASAKAREAWWGLVPDVLDPYKVDREMTEKGLEKLKSFTEYGIRQSHDLPIELAGALGNPAEAARLSAQLRLDKAIDTAATIRSAYAKTHPGDPGNNNEPYNQAVANIYAVEQLGSIAIAQAAAQQSAARGLISGQTFAIQQAEIGERYQSLAIVSQAAGRSVMSPLQLEAHGMQQGQFGEMEVLKREANRAIANASPADKSRIRENYDAQISDLTERQHGDMVRMSSRMIDAGHRLQLEQEEYEAQGAAADETLALRPISSRAVGDVARARRAVELSSSENRAGAITNMQKVLSAQRFELTAQRGGETAIDMPGHLAAGNLNLLGVDLTGRQADIREAQKVYGKGMNDLPEASLNNDVSKYLSQINDSVNRATDLLGTIQQVLSALN